MASFWSLFVASSRVDGEATEGIHDIVLLGTMVGSAVVSPVLVDAPTMWHLSVCLPSIRHWKSNIWNYLVTCSYSSFPPVDSLLDIARTSRCASPFDLDTVSLHLADISQIRSADDSHGCVAGPRGLFVGSYSIERPCPVDTLRIVNTSSLDGILPASLLAEL
jgi:hypothetical protein